MFVLLSINEDVTVTSTGEQEPKNTTERQIDKDNSVYSSSRRVKRSFIKANNLKEAIRSQEQADRGE